MKTIRTIVFVATIFGPFEVFAHEGHGHESPLSPQHYLGNPVHALPLALAVGVAVFFIARKIWNNRSSNRIASKR